ncbi:MAG: iron-containing alcohol dehydrogenase [Bacteroidetes bacterium]|nr:iron-containing alcohol dehydrogenase [Bacteroidota bacterium]MBU1485063.1 iron-containing alcohol dehydrogenase [Bacteroidota bacterium]MBU2046097.1 iron-containing alcohol dehydrogenase [Bacteroidota bacterium]MBU2268405.1 iron-containing alcohol dehydrogenase [Bacteroidota bacterium]MBU2374794.1 iron-containing alcohol dehydrogenase [Bacteroidota bacterium]
MENFQYYNPTKILFGKDVVDQLCNETTLYGNKVLIIIGQGSVKRSGLYARVLSLLNICGMHHVTYEGIKSNPIVQDADEAIKLAKAENVELIIAIGGGSVIDTAKAVAMGFYVDHPVWDFYLQKATRPTQALPLINILTLAATGTEMNSATVLQDDASGMKKGYSAPCLFPKVSFLDPSYTLSVPLNYTAYGVSDLISHALEQFFGKGESPLSDLYTASVIKLAIEYGEKLMHEPDNFEYRSQMMWLATNALNGTLKAGKNSGDWGVHGLEHTLSVLYNIPHGAGLSIVYPAWLKFHRSKINQKLAFLAKEVFSIHKKDENEAANLFILELEKFFIKINTPIRLEEAEIQKSDFNKIIDNFKLNKVSGSVYLLDEKSYDQILGLMWSSSIK